MQELPSRRLSKTGYVLVVLLVLLLVVFVAGHMVSSGEVWNHMTGERFSPWRNYVSDYAYRSSAWPMFVGCIYGLGIILGVLSWSLFASSPGNRMVIWLMTGLLAYSGLKLVEVAMFPVKPPEVSVEEFQSRLDKNSWERLKVDVWQLWEGSRGRPVPEEEAAWELVEAFGNNAGHLIGIRGAMLAIAAAMFLGLMLRLGNRRRWTVVCLISLALVISGMVGIGHGLNGLWQRIAFSGIYIWLWTMVLSLCRVDSAKGPGRG